MFRSASTLDGACLRRNSKRLIGESCPRASDRREQLAAPGTIDLAGGELALEALRVAGEVHRRRAGRAGVLRHRRLERLPLRGQRAARPREGDREDRIGHLVVADGLPHRIVDELVVALVAILLSKWENSWIAW